MIQLLTGDAETVLRALPKCSVQTCVTSPPYFGLRDYGVEGQLGLEATPEAYVDRMVSVFREVRRVLKPTGTLWLNIGDSYCNAKGASHGVDPKQSARRGFERPQDHAMAGLKTKDLIGIPWMLAFALRADGWYLRSDIIWQKPNCMPESTTDRPTRSHEYVFLLTKSKRYYYDQDAIAEPVTASTVARLQQNVAAQQGSARANGGTRTDRPMKAVAKQDGHGRRHAGFNARYFGTEPSVPVPSMRDNFARETKEGLVPGQSTSQHRLGREPTFAKPTRNSRDVWSIATTPYRGAHFAVMPKELVRRCLRAGSAAGDTVLDPFGGSGTVALVAQELDRSAIHIDLNPAYHALAEARTGTSQPMLGSAA